MSVSDHTCHVASYVDTSARGTRNFRAGWSRAAGRRISVCMQVHKAMETAAAISASCMGLLVTAAAHSFARRTWKISVEAAARCCQSCSMLLSPVVGVSRTASMHCQEARRARKELACTVVAARPTCQVLHWLHSTPPRWTPQDNWPLTLPATITDLHERTAAGLPRRSASALDPEPHLGAPRGSYRKQSSCCPQAASLRHAAIHFSMTRTSVTHRFPHSSTRKRPPVWSSRTTLNPCHAQRIQA